MLQQNQTQLVSEEEKQNQFDQTLQRIQEQKEKDKLTPKKSLWEMFGEFKFGERIRSFKLPDGSICKGKFHIDQKLQLMDGVGQCNYADGSAYEGGFRQNHFHGEGELRYPKDKLLKGHFENSQLNGKGKIIYYNGNICEGKFNGGKLNGIGYCQIKNGNFYTGYWLDNKLHGENCIIKTNDGKKYIGNLKYGKFVGIGQIYDENNKLIRTVNHDKSGELTDIINEDQIAQPDLQQENQNLQQNSEQIIQQEIQQDNKI